MKRLNSKGFSAIEVLLIIVVVGLVAGTGWYVWNKRSDTKPSNSLVSISSFLECKNAGYAIAESYPEQCSANGQTFTNNAEVEKVNDKPESPSSEFLNNEVAKIEKVVGPNCSDKMRELNKRDWVIASAKFKYYQEGGLNDYQESNKVSKDYQFANITYGCGSQGSIYVVKKDGNNWKVIAQSATVWSECKDIKGKNVPVEIMPHCYNDDNKLVDATI